GTVVTWFLIGGDAYTAYTLLAVPGMVYGVGASGFFALAYTVLAYPAFFVLMPRLWETAKRRGYVTLADFTQGEHGSAGLGAAVAFTGILATVPYIALQLLGIEVAIAALGAGGNLEALVAAFALLALWDYWGGLRAPASVAFIKDSMVFAFVIAAVVWIPTRLGGYGHIFSAAGEALARRSPVGFLVPQPGQYLGFATLTLGSALAILLYPHVTTSVLSASSSRVIRRNAVYLPAYNLVLGLIALMGYMALAAGVQVASSNDAVPALLLRMMPGWFAGFCLAAIAIGGLVPAAVMAIAASSLFVRSLLRPLLRGGLSGTQETAVTKLVSLGLKLAALGFVVWGRPSYMINFQLLGGVWILQTLPAVVLG
ncbi:MAG: sodium:solute symporter family protein, partial [Terriglobales bacterium]